MSNLMSNNVPDFPDTFSCIDYVSEVLDTLEDLLIKDGNFSRSDLNAVFIKMWDFQHCINTLKYSEK